MGSCGCVGPCRCDPCCLSTNDGAPGLPGSQGSQGKVGSQGPDGSQGTLGPQGSQGVLGSQGPQGPGGGAQGPQGGTGSQGPAGAQGEGGAQGFSGAQGAQGAAGGAQGPQGTPGTPGVPGAIYKYVFKILKILPPGTAYSTFDIRAGGSTPNEGAEVSDFDNTIVEYTDYLCVLEGYNGGGLTFMLPWSSTVAVAGSVVWEIGIRRLQAAVTNITAAHVYDYNAVIDVAPAVSGRLSYPVITFTNGPDMDNWANNELAIVRVRRNTASVSDTMAGDAELWSLGGRET